MTTTMHFMVTGCETLAEGRARAYAIASAFFERDRSDIALDISVGQSPNAPRVFDMSVDAWVRR